MKGGQEWTESKQMEGDVLSKGEQQCKRGERTRNSGEIWSKKRTLK